MPPAQTRAHSSHTREAKINYWGFGRELLIEESQAPHPSQIWERGRPNPIPMPSELTGLAFGLKDGICNSSAAFRFVDSPRRSYRAAVCTLECPSGCCAVEMAALASRCGAWPDLSGDDSGTIINAAKSDPLLSPRTLIQSANASADPLVEYPSRYFRPLAPRISIWRFLCCSPRDQAKRILNALVQIHRAAQSTDACWRTVTITGTHQCNLNRRQARPRGSVSLDWRNVTIFNCRVSFSRGAAVIPGSHKTAQRKGMTLRLKHLPVRLKARERRSYQPRAGHSVLLDRECHSCNYFVCMGRV